MPLDRQIRFTTQGIVDEVLRRTNKSAIVYDDLSTGGFYVSSHDTFSDQDIADIAYLVKGLDLDVNTHVDSKMRNILFITYKPREPRTPRTPKTRR